MANDLVLFDNKQGLSAIELFTPAAMDAVVADLERQAMEFKADMSTRMGREAIASFAHRFSKTKVAIDDMGKDLVAEQKRVLGEIDAQRKRARDKCDELREIVRRPLTEWEKAEEERVNGHQMSLKHLAAMVLFDEPNPTSKDIKQRVEELQAGMERDWEEFQPNAAKIFEEVMPALELRLAATLKYEAEQAELEELRRREKERQDEERRQTLAREAEEKAKRDAQAALDAAEAARVKAEKDAKDAQEREKKAKEESEAKAKAAAEQAVKDEQARQAKAKAAEDAAALARENNKRHRAKINKAAVAALVEHAVVANEEDGKRVVEAIAKGLVPNVSISY